MMKLKNNLKHLIAVAIFLIIPILYFSPILKGYEIFQSDIVNWRGGASELLEFREETGNETYWTNSMFGGMPTYQLGAKFKNEGIRVLDSIFRFLPRPADYVFVAMLSFYILMLCIPVKYKYAIIGALGYGLNTYFFIIIAAGHNAKAHALAYIPLVIAAYWLLRQKKYIIGFVLATLALSLELFANHYQMTYYFFLLIAILAVMDFIQDLKSKMLKSFFIRNGLFSLALVIAVLANSGRFFTTYEYSKHTTRGKTELKETSSSTNPTTGLERDYITQWSYGIGETFNLLLPRLYGGGSSEQDFKRENSIYAANKIAPQYGDQIAQIFSPYWGEQPFVSGPAYQGVTLFALFFIGIFVLNGRIKWWLIGGGILSVVLAWGHNFSVITDLFIDYFPFYNKFRAVSSILTIAELVLPVFAIYTLYQLMENWKPEYFDRAKKGMLVGVGLVVAILVLGGFAFDFSSANDQTIINEILMGQAQMSKTDALKILEGAIEDRKSYFYTNAFMCLALMIAIYATLYFWKKGQLKKDIALVAIALLIVLDLYSFNKNYLNDANFETKRQVENPVPRSPIDEEILKDKSNYRVFNSSRNFMQDAITSFYHKSIGGYHGAKLRRYQEMVSYALSENTENILAMLNTKYIIGNSEEGLTYQINEKALGNAWFINEIIASHNADNELLALQTLDASKEAVIQEQYLKKDLFSFKTDSTSIIELTSYAPNKLRYSVDAKDEGYVVFSEIYYPDWTAKIDGKKATIIPTNYILRGMYIPKGKHTIDFTFDPPLVQQANTLNLVGSILLFLTLIGGLLFYFKQNTTKLKN